MPDGDKMRQDSLEEGREEAEGLEEVTAELQEAMEGVLASIGQGEDLDDHEFVELNAKLDSLHSALDVLETRNDSIVAELRRMLEENRALAEEGAA